MTCEICGGPLEDPSRAGYCAACCEGAARETGTYQMASESREESLLPRVLPVGWRRLSAAGPVFECRGAGGLAGLVVLFSVGTESDGREWIHVSASRRGKTPSWEDMEAVKTLFLGERWAFQVLPPREKHYTLPTVPDTRAGYVLHLWARSDGANVLPDFLAARGGTL